MCEQDREPRKLVSLKGQTEIVIEKLLSCCVLLLHFRVQFIQIFGTITDYYKIPVPTLKDGLTPPLDEMNNNKRTNRVMASSTAR